MKTIIRVITASITFFALTACSGGGNKVTVGSISLPAPVPAPASGSFGDGRLGQLVEWTRATHGLPAMAAVVVRDGQLVEIAAEGLRSSAGNQSVTSDDKWHLGSLSKAFTASLAGVLVEQFVVSWDTTPLDVWPELDADIHPSLRGITLRQLLSHTAGIRRVNAAPSKYGDQAAGSIVEKRREFAADLLAETPAAPIGQHSYSNGGYIIAGAMMETLMGGSWETLVSDFVFTALNMTESGFGAPGVPGELTQPWGHWDSGINYDPVSPGPDADNPQVFGPAGTIHATLRDYALFMLAHIEGARGIDSFLTAATFQTLHTAIDSGSALGWGVIQDRSGPGVIDLVHDGSNQRWYASVRLIPELNIGALYVVNAGGDLAGAAIEALDDLLEERYENSQ